MPNGKRIELPSVSFVVARTHDTHVIGCENKLPWRIPSDLKRFKAITHGHAVIMGRKTHESIGRILPGRLNIVISRHPGVDKENLNWAPNKETALHLADIYTISNNLDEVFVIGGSEIYSMFSNLFNKIHLTEVFADNIKGDAFFEQKFDRRMWKMETEIDHPATDGDQYPSRYSVLNSRMQTKRYAYSINYLTEGADLKTYLEKIDLQNQNRPSGEEIRPARGRSASDCSKTGEGEQSPPLPLISAS